MLARTQAVLWTCWLLAAVFAGAVRGQGAGTASADTGGVTQELSLPEVIRVSVNLVTVRFTVRDGEGNFDNRLGPEDFEVLENGQVREIRYFAPPRRSDATPRPLWVAFLVDVSGSTFATRAEEILAAQAFLENIHALTRVGVFGFTDRLIVFEDFTSDRRRALEAFGKARSHMGRTALYASLEELAARLDQQARPGDERVIIVVSDGLDDDFRRADETIRRLRRRNTVVYTVWIPSALELYVSPSPEVADRQTGDLSELQAKRAAFARVSAETGGRHFGGFEAILDFGSVMAEIENDLLGNLYTIGYQTEFPFLDESERRVEVRVRKPGLRAHGVFRRSVDWVEARRRFVSAMFSLSSTGVRQPSPIGIRGESDAVFRDIAAELDVLRGRREDSLAAIPFRLKIGPYALARDEGGGVRTYFGVLGVLYDLGGREVARLREVFRAQLTPKQLQEGRGVIYTNRLLAPPGTYVLQVLLLEIPTWRMTVLQREIQAR
ncbi:MAG: hypothetical protein Kow00109_01370 [Acidobacteriota bacterium]